MTWQWVTLILGIVWAAIALAGIAMLSNAGEEG